ncbi:MAG: putative aminodeoxychorismate lyase [Firmicutes bacterium ADurb.Bin456]|nr:MAG: putative aminodeoxychorismate lyase [Firmicutes bacterium ADurb.Bin456]
MSFFFNQKRCGWQAGGQLARHLGILISILGLACLGILYVVIALTPVAPKNKARDIVMVVPQQSTATQVGQLLKDRELIRSPFIFVLYARWKNLDGSLKAGEYLLSNGLTTPQMLNELVDGRLAAVTITVPEGFTLNQVAELLEAKGLGGKEEFLSVAAREDFPSKILESRPKDERRLEGYLFPDTYQVTRGENVRFIIDLMLKRFEREIEDLNYPARAKKAGLTLHEAVTLASLVEREAKIDAERPLISGVIHNRMKKAMLLQIDATVQYALGANKPQVYYKDLEVDSPYNTYRNNGLPPGPIAMPGRSSLLAAVEPAETVYLYYVARPDGSHAFATNYADHMINKERYQR